jgi:hypothetical protein
MLNALKKTVETIVADLRDLGPLPNNLVTPLGILEWSIEDSIQVSTLWDCVSHIDWLASVADVQGYGGVAERYRRASRNLKPAIVNYEGTL